MKIYIGCAINKSDQVVGDIVETLKTELAAAGHQLLNFVGTDPDVSPETVFHTDLACTTEADLMIAIADQPSTGLGMEVQNRIALEKKTIIAHQPGNKISRMVLGAVAAYPFLSVVEYETAVDIVKQVDV